MSHCPAFDTIFPEGFPFEGVVQLWSKTSPAAISMTALSIARSAAESGFDVVYVGSEGYNGEHECVIGGMPKYARERLTTLDISYLEDVLELVDALEEEKRFLIIDGITTLACHHHDLEIGIEECDESYREESKLIVTIMKRLRLRSARLHMPTLVTSAKGDRYPPSSYGFGDAPDLRPDIYRFSDYSVEFELVVKYPEPICVEEGVEVYDDTPTPPPIVSLKLTRRPFASIKEASSPLFNFSSYYDRRAMRW